jgi:1-acylglycerone phosphate reductase
MSSPKKTVLITGCSDGSLGAGLAVAFHKAGLKVYATARNLAKMSGLEALGIEILTLDVLDDTSIAKTASEITQLDILGKKIIILNSRATQLTHSTSQ